MTTIAFENVRTTSATLFLFVVLAPVSAFAQDAAVIHEEATTSTLETGEIEIPLETETEIEAVPEEIVVIGSRSLTLLRYEMVQAEDNFFNLYNSLNDDDRYDIICKNETPTGSHIPVRKCKARVFRDAESRAAENQMLANSTGANQSLSARISSKHYKTLEEKLRVISISNPEVQQALMEYDRLNKKLKDERRKKFDID